MVRFAGKCQKLGNQQMFPLMHTVSAKGILFIIKCLGELSIWIFAEIYLNNLSFETYYLEIKSHFQARSQRSSLKQPHISVFKGVDLMLRKIKIPFIKHLSPQTSKLLLIGNLGRNIILH